MRTRTALKLGAFLGILTTLPVHTDAADVRSITARAALPARLVTEEYVNPSALLFGRAPRRGAEISEEVPPPIAASEMPPPPGPAFSTQRITRVAHWNWKPQRVEGTLIQLGSEMASLASLGLEASEAAPATRSAQWEGGVACVEPDIVKPGSTCCSYGILDQISNKKTYYRQPAWAFSSGGNAASEQTCRGFAETVTASMPLFVPYKSGHVRPSHGWFYNGGDFHGAVDYGKDDYPEGEDPSFKIYSIGAGIVRSVVWDNWSGNIVVVEHVAPDGKKYRSAYKHMRNGFSHDLALARAIPVPADKMFDANGKPTQSLKYQRFANLPNPSKLQWGTEDQKIAVKPGDHVSAGEFLGWSGDTGPGGAGKGLNDDGTPKNAVTANNHLHFMLCVPHPTGGETEWVQVDPYGVYAQVDTDCYDVLDDTPYVRLFAPFYTAFHNVPIAVFTKRFGYFPGMGYGLQTVSLHRRNDRVLVSGAFQYGLSAPWVCRVYMTSDEYQRWFDEYGKAGFGPRELSVTNDGQGNARFSAIWRKGGAGSFAAVHNLTDAQWKQKWDDLVVKGKMRVEECVSYTDRGASRLAGIFVSDAERAFYEKHYMDSATLQSSFNAFAGQGFALTNVNAAVIGGKTVYAGVWRKQPGSWVAKHGMTPQEYQKLFDQFSSSGYRLYQVCGYDNSERFAALWHKP